VPRLRPSVIGLSSILLKVVKEGKSETISLDHPDGSVARLLFAEALGTSDADFANGLLRQMVFSNSGNAEIPASVFGPVLLSAFRRFASICPNDVMPGSPSASFRDSGSDGRYWLPEQ
jgi:hypothetical protein